jgi:chromodomain-helicase-DNA-binding protein 4
VDEGHRVKNMRSKLGTLLKRQTTDFRLLLTVCHVVLIL